jgi:hypothetical protein
MNCTNKLTKVESYDGVVEVSILGFFEYDGVVPLSLTTPRFLDLVTPIVSQRSILPAVSHLRWGGKAPSLKIQTLDLHPKAAFPSD